MKFKAKYLRPPTDVMPQTIYKTEAFKGLSSIGKRLAKSWNNIMAIDNNLKAASKMGLDRWLQTTNANQVNRAIVAELLTNK